MQTGSILIKIFYSKSIFSTLIALIFSNIILCQIKRNPLNYPTKKEVYEGLISKPVKLYSPRDYDLGININDSIKNKLVELLDFQWSIDEIENYLDFQFSKSKVYYNLDYVSTVQSNYKSKNDYLKKIREYDKLRISIRKNDLEILIKNELTSINPRIIYLIGLLYITNAIPKLNNIAKDSALYPKFAVELTLARLGDTLLQTKYLNTSQWNFDKTLNDEYWIEEYSSKSKLLFYLNSQESISKLGMYLDTSKTLCIKSHNCVNVRASNQVIYDLCRSIQNKDFLYGLDSIVNIKEYYFDWEDAISVKAILYCKRWLEANKGKYQLEQNYFLYKFPNER
jgi:hypothetical protein